MTNRLVVSDHAAMRWLERGVGFDINMLKRTVADALDNAFQAAEKLGSQLSDPGCRAGLCGAGRYAGDGDGG
jgi:hypothetical protein